MGCQSLPETQGSSKLMHSWGASLQNGLQCRDMDTSMAAKMQLLQSTPLHVLQCMVQLTWALSLLAASILL